MCDQALLKPIFPMARSHDASGVPEEAAKAIIERYFWDNIVPELTMKWAEEGRLYEVVNGWMTWTTHGWVDCMNYASDDMINNGIDRWAYGLEDRVEVAMIEVGIGTLSTL
jgi:hypothetical protein